MYLWHQIDSEGLHATADKVEAMVRAPIPKNVQELRSFFGLLNYYRKLFPIFASLLQRLDSATSRMQLEIDSRMHQGFQSFQRSYTLSKGTYPL